MLRSWGLPTLFISLGLLGMFHFAVPRLGDRDPQWFYFTAGKCLGRASWYYTQGHEPDDPLYSRASANGGALLVHYDRMVPYRDFVCEYPPAALPSFILPRLFTDDLRTYYWLFAAEMAVPVIGLWWIAIRIAQLMWPERAMFKFVSGMWMLWIWVAGTVLLHRFDIVAIFFVALGTLCTLRRQWGRAGFCLGIGAAIKVYPALLLIPLTIASFGDRRWKSVVRLWGSAIIAPLLSHLVLLPWIGTALFSYITYHSDRGFEVESIWAQLILFFANPGGDSIHSVKLFGCDQLTSTQSLRGWIAASYAAMVGTSILCSVAAYFKIAPVRSGTAKWRARVVALLLATIVLSVVSAKVLSIQYVFWMFPFAILIPGRMGRAICVAYFVALEMGNFWFPDYWLAVSQLTTAAMVLVFARNVLLLAIALLALIAATRFTASDPDPQIGGTNDISIPQRETASYAG